MIQFKKLFEENKFPKYINSHPIFKEVSSTKKVFPSIGLANFEEEVEIDNKNASKKSAKKLVNAISASLEKRIAAIPLFIKKNEKMDPARIAYGNKCIAIMSALVGCIKKSDDLIKENNGRITINIPSDVFIEGEDRPIFREGQGLFRAYNSLNDLLKEQKFAVPSKLDDMEVFKDFSRENIPNNKLKIIFSSDGNVGAWDIATMSMRGVSSCQSWEGEYSGCLIGSIIDPFVGIIYLTSGGKYNDYGTKMMRRCVVRFTINSKTSKPVLIMDTMYPGFDKEVCNQFKEALKKRVSKDIDVIHYSENHKTIEECYIPFNKVREKLKSFSNEEDDFDEDDEAPPIASNIVAYQDCKIKDGQPGEKDKQVVLFEKNCRIKEKTFSKNLTDSMRVALAALDIADFPATVRPIAELLKGGGGNKKSFSKVNILSKIGEKLAEDFIENIDQEECSSSNNYLKKIYFSYFASKNKTIENAAERYSKIFNTSLGLKANKRLSQKHLGLLMSPIFQKMDPEMKKSFKEIGVKKPKKSKKNSVVEKYSEIFATDASEENED